MTIRSVACASRHMPAAAKSAASRVPWRRLILRILPVTLTYFCYGWSLWLFLNWLPSFFLQGYNLDIKKSALYASGVFFAGVVGDALGGIISDYLLHKTGNVTLSRLSVILTGMLGATACLIPVLFSRDVFTLALCLSGGFFFLELVIGPIWSVPMDIAPQYSGTASGLMNTGSAVAAIVSPLAFGYIVDVTGNWHLGIDYPREKESQSFAAQSSFFHRGLVSFIALGTNQHAELSMDRVSTTQIQGFPVIRFQFVPIIAIDAPLHLEREFFSKNSQKNP